MSKRYYWLKLQKDFFTQPKIKKLRKIAGGDTYTIIYLKMQLLSLSNGGKLFFDGIEESFSEEIALTIDEDPDNVKVTVQYLLSQGLIEPCSETEFLMTETQSLICSESVINVVSSIPFATSTIICPSATYGLIFFAVALVNGDGTCLLYTSPSPRDRG